MNRETAKVFGWGASTETAKIKWRKIERYFVPAMVNGGRYLRYTGILNDSKVDGP